MKVKELKPGQVFRYAGYEWIKLEQEGLALMKDILEERAFDNECNNWGKSEVREYLNNEFYNTLIRNGADEEDFLMVKTDLKADDGTNEYAACYDYISLMTADLYRSNRHLLKPLESWWWLATPHSCLASDSYIVRYVVSTGTLHVNYAYDGSLGVRPLCNLSSETLVSVPGEEEEAEEMNTTELIKRWAIDRGIDAAEPEKQFLKVIEEVGELAEGMAKGRPDEIKDSYIKVTRKS